MSDIDKLLGDIQKPKISNLTVLILGKPKTGKSTFAASSATAEEKTIMLNIEKGLSFIQETENLRIYPSKEKACTKTDLDKLYKALSKGDHNYKNIVFDTADEFWNILVDDYLKGIRVKRPNQEGIELQDYNPLYEKYQKTINAFKNLGLNIFLTAHTKRFDDDPKQVIALPGKLGGLIGGSVDMILHLTAKTINGKMETTLYTQPNVLLDAGHRHFGNPLPEKMINAKWQEIPAILEKGIKEIPTFVKKEEKQSSSKVETVEDIFKELTEPVISPDQDKAEVPEVGIPKDPGEIRKAFLSFCRGKGLTSYEDLTEFGKKNGFKSEEPEYLAKWLYELPDKLETVILEFISEKTEKAA